MNSNESSKPITAELSELLGGDADEVQQRLTKFYDWMLEKGLNPARKKPLAPSTAGNYHNRIDQLYRFNIKMINPSDLTVITHDQADQIIKWLDEDQICRRRDGDIYEEDAKRKFANTLDKYFSWRSDTAAVDNWSPDITFSQSEYDSADKLNFTERGKLRETALNYGSLPAYYEVDPDERDRINGLVAQRLGKPKESVTSTDWEQADKSNKVGSLIAVALDTGITPVEVEEARTHWYKSDRNILKIPAEHASKNRPTTKLPLTEDTGAVMSKWIQERRHYERYDGTNRLWLNEHGNPYNSKNLCNLLKRLCDEAGIPYADRKVVWYSLRHNMGQSIEEEEDLSEAHDQLRHRNYQTTKEIYAKSPIESRRQTLEEVQETAARAASDPSFNPYADDDDQSNPPRRESQSKQSDSSSGDLHVDARIADTPQGRNKLIKQIISDDEAVATSWDEYQS